MTNRLPRVMVDDPLPAELRELLQREIEMVAWSSEPADGTGIVGIFTYGHPQVDGALMDHFPDLRVISNHGVGTDHIDSAAAKERGIPVGNTPGVLDGAVADLAMTLMLASARRLPESARLASMSSPDGFGFRQPLGHDVHGRTLGIVGLGRIGEQIAKRALAFEMTLLYHNRRRRTDLEQRMPLDYCSLEELLGRSDFVILSVPLTSETRHLIGASQLQAMKRSATLINIARGAVVQTDALVEALRAGWLAAAALDVTDPEPLPVGHPLLAMPQVLITSHIGSATVETRRAMERLAVDNLLCGLRGERLRFAVG